MGQYVPSLNQTQMLGVNTIFLQPNNSLVNTMDWYISDDSRSHINYPVEMLKII